MRAARLGSAVGSLPERPPEVLRRLLIARCVEHCAGLPNFYQLPHQEEGNLIGDTVRLREVVATDDDRVGFSESSSRSSSILAVEIGSSDAHGSSSMITPGE